MDSTLFVHYPCFDGLASGAIAWAYLEREAGWTVSRLRFVNYDVRDTWLETALPDKSAVVDFLYHPRAAFWADHHGTAFRTSQAAADFSANRAHPDFIYDAKRASCAGLLRDTFVRRGFESARFDMLARWADRIDAAKYDSVEEAIFGIGSAAAEINLSLTFNADDTFGELLLRALRDRDLDEVAAFPEVQTRLKAARDLAERGLALVRENIALQSSAIAVSAVTTRRGELINRYSPYLVYPNARYSVTLNHSPRGPKITAMRNPWLEFESVNLGHIFSQYGGGGHQRVASVNLGPQYADDAEVVLAQIVSEIQHETFLQSRNERVTA